MNLKQQNRVVVKDIALDSFNLVGHPALYLEVMRHNPRSGLELFLKDRSQLRVKFGKHIKRYDGRR